MWEINLYQTKLVSSEILNRSSHYQKLCFFFFETVYLLNCALKNVKTESSESSLKINSLCSGMTLFFGRSHLVF